MSLERLIKFGLVGGVCAGVQLLLLGLFIHVFAIGNDIGENIANLVAFAISAQLNFMFSYFFTWSDRKTGAEDLVVVLKKMAAFNTMIAGSLAINQLAFFIANMYVSAIAAGAVGIALAAVFNFVLSSKLVFNPQLSEKGS